jgi:hypothetical protein
LTPSADVASILDAHAETIAASLTLRVDRR